MQIVALRAKVWFWKRRVEARYWVASAFVVENSLTALV